MIRIVGLEDTALAAVLSGDPPGLGDGVFRLEVDGRLAAEVCPGAGETALRFPVPARWHDGREHDCRILRVEASELVARARVTIPARNRGRTARLICRLSGSALVAAAPPWIRSLEVRGICGGAAFSRRITRRWHDPGGAFVLCDLLGEAGPGRPLCLTVEDADTGLPLEGGTLVTGTRGRPLIMGRLEAVDGPFLSGCVIRLPAGEADPAGRVRLVRRGGILTEAALTQFRPDCLGRWQAPWSGFTAFVPPGTRPGRIALEYDGRTLHARRFSRYDAALSGWCDRFVFGRGLSDPEAAATELARWLARHSGRLRKKRRSLHEILKGALTILALTGRFDVAARLLSEPGVFDFLGCGDGRVMEGLRAVIDEASPEVLPEMLPGIAAADAVGRRLFAPRLRLRLSGGADAAAREMLTALLAEAGEPMHLRLLAHETLIRYAT